MAESAMLIPLPSLALSQGEKVCCANDLYQAFAQKIDILNIIYFPIYLIQS